MVYECVRPRASYLSANASFFAAANTPALCLLCWPGAYEQLAITAKQPGKKNGINKTTEPPPRQAFPSPALLLLSSLDLLLKDTHPLSLPSAPRTGVVVGLFFSP